MGPGNTVDIGIFDSRGHAFLDDAGFRGWSGTSKREFFIAPQEATPGYLRGPLFPGQWNVMLGLARVQPEGVHYDVSVKLTLADAGALPEQQPDGLPRGSARAPSKAKGKSRWVKGDLHCHTLHSDGLNSVEELARLLAGAGSALPAGSSALGGSRSSRLRLTVTS